MRGFSQKNKNDKLYTKRKLLLKNINNFLNAHCFERILAKANALVFIHSRPEGRGNFSQTNRHKTKN